MRDPFAQTPDLSGEVHPQPKVYKKKKEPKPLNKMGKRTEAWVKGHPDLVLDFEQHGVKSCEVLPFIKKKHKTLLKKYDFLKCAAKYFLGFAHRERRKVFNVEELVKPKNVCLACVNCHTILDQKMPKAESEKLMQEIIDNRGW